jgi:hypothetical protein
MEVRFLAWRVGVGLVGGAPGVVIGAHFSGANGVGLAAIYAGTMLFVGLVVVWRLATLGKQLAPVLDRYELLMSDRVLRRFGIGPVAEVLSAEVTEIFETPLGLWISCATPHRSLFVIRALDGYADVRDAVSRWAPIRSLGWWPAFRHARREMVHQGPRDAVLGTALATDESLGRELEAVRAASANGFGVAALRVPSRAGQVMAVFAFLIMMSLAVYQLLKPSNHRPPVMTDQTCQESRGCRLWGRCKSSEDECTAATDADCAQSEGCTKLGRCKAVGGTCYADDRRVPPSER